MKLTPNLKTFIIRLLIFFLIIFIISALIGPWIISTRLLYGFYFFIYPNIGKVLMIGTIAFFFMSKDKLRDVNITKVTKKNFIFLFISLILFIALMFFSQELLEFQSISENIPLFLLVHGIFIGALVYLTLGVFSWSFISEFLKRFKKEFLICAGLSIFLYFMIFQVWKLWPFFSDLVLKMVYVPLSLGFERVRVVAPRLLIVNNFRVTIAQACSGVDSLFLFTVLYWFFGFVDWNVFNKKKLVIMFFPATIGLFLVNVLRIYLLVLIGAMWSPKLALTLFHTYAGLLLFLVYFMLFWKVFYRWMKL